MRLEHERNVEGNTRRSRVFLPTSWLLYSFYDKEFVKFPKNYFQFWKQTLFPKWTTVSCTQVVLFVANPHANAWKPWKPWKPCMPCINFAIRKVNLMFVFIVVVWTFFFNKYMIALVRVVLVFVIVSPAEYQRKELHVFWRKKHTEVSRNASFYK